MFLFVMRVIREPIYGTGADMLYGFRKTRFDVLMLKGMTRPQVPVAQGESRRSFGAPELAIRSRKHLGWFTMFVGVKCTQACEMELTAGLNSRKEFWCLLLVEIELDTKILARHHHRHGRPWKLSLDSQQRSLILQSTPFESPPPIQRRVSLKELNDLQISSVTSESLLRSSSPFF